MLYKQQILLIVNPISGGTDKTELTDAITDVAANKGYDIIIHETSCDDEDIIRQKLEQLQPSRVFVAGGDGTIQQAAKLLQGTDIPLGIFPVGSANGFAVSIDIATDDMEQQITVAFGDRMIDSDLLEINGHICIHIADIGVNAELIKNYEEGSIRGKLGYVLQSIPSFIKAKFPYTYNIQANGNTYTQTGILLAIANADKFGTGARINPTGKINDRVFELILFKNFDLQGIIKTMNGELTPDMEFVEIICTDKAVITTDTPVPLQVDGEFIDDVTKTEVRMLPHTVRLLVPESYMNSKTEIQD